MNGQTQCCRRRLVTAMIVQLLLASVLLSPLSCRLPVLSRQKSDSFTDPLLDQLSPLWPDGSAFRSQTYLFVAQQLQMLDEASRIKRLRQWSDQKWSDQQDDKQVIVLCRMLFDPKEGEYFRAPILGAPRYIGSTDFSWPLEPIAIAEQVPIMIVRDHGWPQSSGPVETGRDYLDYCLQNCQWTKRRYRIRQEDELDGILTRFLSTIQWRVPLSQEDLDFIVNQIFPPRDHLSFVNIATFDPNQSTHVMQLLERNSIPSSVEGSVVYSAVSIPLFASCPNKASRCC